MSRAAPQGARSGSWSAQASPWFGLWWSLSAPSPFAGGFRLATLAARLKGGHLQIAAGGDGARGILALQRIECRPHHVVRIGRALRLGDDVMHTERLEN